MGSRPPWATARRSGRPGNKEFNAPEADFGQAQVRLVFADEQCPPRQKKVAAFRGRAMLAPTLLTKCGSRTNLSVGFAASSLRQKKLAALGFESAFRGGRPSQPSVRTGQLPQRGSQGGGSRTNLSVGFDASSLRQKKLAPLGFETGFGDGPLSPGRVGMKSEKGPADSRAFLVDILLFT